MLERYERWLWKKQFGLEQLEVSLNNFLDWKINGMVS